MMSSFLLRSIVVVFISGVFSIFSYPSLSQSGDIGKPAPDFELNDTSDQLHALSQYKGKYVILEWLNFQCKDVDRRYRSGYIPELQAQYAEKEVVWLSVVSSAPGRQGHAPGKQIARQVEKREGQQAAVLIDDSGTIGPMYGVEKTPHFFIIDPEGILIYQGALDNQPDASVSQDETFQNYIDLAMDDALNGREVAIPTTQPYGCPIKYVR